MPQQSPGASLRALMDDHCVMLPGAFNGLVGRAVAHAGFEGTYVSGAAVTASFGVPDIGLVTLDGFTNVIHQVAMGSGLPIIADADTGFGEGEMVTRTVFEYHRAGAAGLHIEDQQFPKRCGHLDGKTLISKEDFATKVKRAADARDACSNGEFIICARTDAYGVDGFDAAVDRAKAYVDAGADMIFPEGMKTEEDFGNFAKALGTYGPKGKTYLLANMTEFGKTPIIPHARFAELGYSCVIFPVSTLRSAMGEVTRMLGALKEEGSVESVLQQMQSRKDLYELLGYTPGVEWTYPDRTQAPQKKPYPIPE